MQEFHSRQSRILVLVLLSVFAWVHLSAAATLAVSNPPTVVTNTGGTTVLMKDLNSAGRYGLADDAADILYPGQTGTWTFVLSAVGLDPANYSPAKATISLILDDHYARSTALYSINIALPSGAAFSGNTDLLGMAHGLPVSGTPFVNWTNSTFTSSLVPDSFAVSIQNTSSGFPDDWIGIDKIQIELTAVPEPSGLSLLSIAVMVGFSWRIWARKSQTS